MKRVIIFSVIIAISFFVCIKVFAAETVSYVEHQKNMNQLICKKKVECVPDTPLDLCVSTWDRLAEIDTEHQALSFDRQKSQKCVLYFNKNVSCDNFTVVYTQGDCALSVLSGEM